MKDLRGGSTTVSQAPKAGTTIVTTCLIWVGGTIQKTQPNLISYYMTSSAFPSKMQGSSNKVESMLLGFAKTSAERFFVCMYLLLEC